MALVLAEKKCIFSKIPQKCSVFNETQDLSFFFDGRFNRGVVFSIFTFVCLLSWPQAFFFKKHRFLPFFPSLVKRTIILVIFFFKFSRLHLITVAKSWQNLPWISCKSLKFSNFSSFCLYFSQILSFPSPVFKRYDTNSFFFSIFSSLMWSFITSFFIQAFQNATFGVKNSFLAQKLAKLAIFHLFLSFLC